MPACHRRPPLFTSEERTVLLRRERVTRLEATALETAAEPFDTI